MKYYFITYRSAIRKNPSTYSIWNQCIDISPMDFIKNLEEAELVGNGSYFCFVILNTLEITKEEFKKFKGKF